MYAKMYLNATDQNVSKLGATNCRLQTLYNWPRYKSELSCHLHFFTE